MKCGEQEKTANSPLHRPNSLHHQQHFINNRRLAEQKEGSSQTQIDARTIVLLLRSERLQDQKKPLHTAAKKQTTQTHGLPARWAALQPLHLGKLLPHFCDFSFFSSHQTCIFFPKGDCRGISL